MRTDVVVEPGAMDPVDCTLLEGAGGSVIIRPSDLTGVSAALEDGADTSDNAPPMTTTAHDLIEEIVVIE